MIEGLSAEVHVPDELLLAGYFVTAPERLAGSGMPRSERLLTASECLSDRLPQSDCWFGTAHEALAACLLFQVTAEARLYALLVPSEHVGGFVADIRAAGLDEPVLLAHLDGGGVGEAAREVAEDGHERGWEVLGYDHGLLHSWLCNDLYDDAVLSLGVGVNEHGLLPDRDTAQRVAAWANARDDTKPVTWFPGALIEWGAPIESRPGPATTENTPSASEPWWRRVLQLWPPTKRP
ncbi:hypothetical protein ACGF07_20950 [Kitasatospora sp. NPDC048194]|uniref:hypothetical protein n=1 Tax=Kitasatospora sp. NPDC048194 TaxID=3364045 RepID=UPI003714B440